MDAETGKIVAVVTVVVVGIILARTCDYLLCGEREVFREREDESQAIREFEDELNEIRREIIKLSWRRGKELNLSTCQKIKLF